MITQSHRNAMGAVMGGVYFMLADFAFAVAANWEKMGCVSLHSDISFLGAAKGNRLTAKAICVKDGRTAACYRVDVTDEFENLSEDIDDDRDMQQFNTQNFYNRQHYCGNRLVPHDKKCNGKGT